MQNIQIQLNLSEKDSREIAIKMMEVEERRIASEQAISLALINMTQHVFGKFAEAMVMSEQNSSKRLELEMKRLEKEK
jgi:hypothetical protein